MSRPEPSSRAITRRQFVHAVLAGSMLPRTGREPLAQAARQQGSPPSNQSSQGQLGTGPEAPRVRPDTTPKSSGTVTVATPGTLQSAIDSARPGDRILCDPSRAWPGHWRINRPAGQVPITIASSRPNQPVRFIAVAPQPVFLALGPVGGVQWEHVEVTLDPKVNYSGGQSLVQLGEAEPFGQHPRGFGFRNSHLHGNPGQDVRRAILTNCGDFFFLDGRIDEIHQRGSDSQAICGWNAAEGHLIRNSFLEAATENIMYGGSGNTGGNMNPRDITIERVTLSKRKEWDPSSPTFAGIRWNIKNHLEFKNAQRVVVNGLRCVNCFTDGQTGRSIVITPRDVPGHPWIVAQDIDIANALISDVNSAFVLLGHDDAAGASQPAATATQRVRFRNCLFRINPGGKCFEISADNYDVELDRLTWVATGPLYATVIMGGTITRLKATNLVTAHGSAGWTGAQGEGNRVRKLFPTPVAWNQVLEVGAGAQPISDGASNDFLPGALEAVQDPTAVFVNLSKADYHLKPGYAGRGADLDGILAAIPALDTSAAAGSRQMAEHRHILPVTSLSQNPRPGNR